MPTLRLPTPLRTYTGGQSQILVQGKTVSEAMLDLVNQYQIMMIPTEILFDGNGQKILAHIGFWPKEQMVSQIDALGID